ncbi:hypothetical protein [Haloferula helveola]
MRGLHSILCALACLLTAGCGLFGSDDEPEESPTAAKLVGRVASVHEADGFVLVQGFDDLKLGDGLLLSARGEGEQTATLVVTGERMGRYTAADLKSGSVSVGDSVYARPIEEESEMPATDAPIGLPTGGLGAE